MRNQLGYIRKMRCFNYLQLQNQSEFENLDRTQGGIRIQNTDPNQKPASSNKYGSIPFPNPHRIYHGMLAIRVCAGGAFLPLQSDIFLPGGRGFANQAIMSSQGIQQVSYLP
jgi:hypothetical protein